MPQPNLSRFVGPSLAISIIAIFCLAAAQTEATGTYGGYAAPAKSAEIFAPGVISTDAYEFAVTFTPDMGEISFTRRQDPEPNFILMAKVTGDGVGGPTSPAFSKPGGEYESCIAPDGMTITFSQDRTIKICSRSGDGWSPAHPPTVGGILRPIGAADPGSHRANSLWAESGAWQRSVQARFSFTRIWVDPAPYR